MSPRVNGFQRQTLRQTLGDGVYLLGTRAFMMLVSDTKVLLGTYWQKVPMLDCTSTDAGTIYCSYYCVSITA